jgi:hypothetical protein
MECANGSATSHSVWPQPTHPRACRFTLRGSLNTPHHLTVFNCPVAPGGTVVASNFPLQPLAVPDRLHPPIATEVLVVMLPCSLDAPHELEVSLARGPARRPHKCSRSATPPALSGFPSTRP